jgi:large subunit ribosomal protein L24
MALKLQRNDTVEVITGTDKGKRGRVLRVLSDKDRVLVEHVRMVKKHVHPNPQRNIKGGIAEQEAAIQISNVMLVCGTCGLKAIPRFGCARSAARPWQQRKSKRNLITQR